ncbi:MAG TPA: hypothetical protein VK904_04450 [Miltoncostaeaceae bacterium]|nr:hypothetical protein [Miltoncostaeaceae bacterium]
MGSGRLGRDSTWTAPGQHLDSTCSQLLEPLARLIEEGADNVDAIVALAMALDAEEQAPAAPELLAWI